MKRLIILGNIALLFAVLAAGIALHNQQPAARHPELPPFNPAAEADDGAAAAAPRPVAVRGLALRDSEKNILWEETLFDPDRREGSAGDGGDDDEGTEPQPTQKVGDMELIGIGKIDKRQAAIILVRSRRRGNDAEKTTKNIYRVNEEVKDTGYTLVRIEKGEVELARNDESRVLALNLGDKASQQRASRAAAADQQQRRETQQQESPPEPEEDSAPSPPPPPPPPPAPGAASQPSGNGKENRAAENAQQERRERIRRALEARRRLLEKRRQERNSNQ